MEEGVLYLLTHAHSHLHTCTLTHTIDREIFTVKIFHRSTVPHCSAYTYFNSLCVYFSSLWCTGENILMAKFPNLRYAHAHPHSHIYVHLCTHSHVHTLTCAHTLMCTHSHVHTLTCAHTHMCTHSQGNYFERTSVLSGLLSVTTVIDRLNPLHLRDERYSCFTGLRNFPNISSVDALNCLVSVCVCAEAVLAFQKWSGHCKYRITCACGAGGPQQAMCGSKNYLWNHCQCSYTRINTIQNFSNTCSLRSDLLQLHVIYACVFSHTWVPMQSGRAAPGS